MRRRTFLSGCGAVVIGAAANAQEKLEREPPRLPQAAPSPEPFASLREGTPHHLTPEQEMQRVVASPAPAGPPGRWESRASLPIPRSEMAWATTWAGRLHVVGGYGEGRVDRAYHHIYEPASDRWFSGASLPRGANHVAVAADAGRVYALGGFIEQNRNPDHNAYAYEIAEDRWRAIAPLPRPRGAAAAVVLDGRVHLIGGASELSVSKTSFRTGEGLDESDGSRRGAEQCCD